MPTARSRVFLTRFIIVPGNQAWESKSAIFFSHVMAVRAFLCTVDPYPGAIKVERKSDYFYKYFSLYILAPGVFILE